MCQNLLVNNSRLRTLNPNHLVVVVFLSLFNDYFILECKFCRARIENIKSYLLKYKPDIVMMQEIKTEDVNFPYDDFSSMDYESHVFGQKSYNGVAIISKSKLKNIRTDLIKDKLKQSRIISAEFEYKKKTIQLINIYTPNGNPVDTEKYDYKKNWMDQLIKQLKTLSKKNSNIILAGDFNVIPAAEDVYNVKSFEDDALYRLEIRKKFREMLNLGLMMFTDILMKQKKVILFGII